MADRKKVIGLLQEMAEYFRDCRSNASFASKAENHFWELQNAANDALELLKEQETETGTWILDDEDANSWECSKCGDLLLINDGTPYENGWFFCPHCGAKLEEQAVKQNEC